MAAGHAEFAADGCKGWAHDVEQSSSARRRGHRSDGKAISLPYLLYIFSLYIIWETYCGELVMLMKYSK